VGGTRFGRACAGVGSWRDMVGRALDFTGNPLGGSLVEEVGTKGEKAGQIRGQRRAEFTPSERRSPRWRSRCRV
jgi:hypothetical protein